MSESSNVAMRLKRKTVFRSATISVIGGLVVIWLIFMNARSLPASAVITKKGSPLLVVRSADIEEWDLESQSLFPAKKLVLEEPRQWKDKQDPLPSTVLIYSENVFVQAYSQMVLSGEAIIGNKAAYAIGERARITCIYLDTRGNVRREKAYDVPFIEFRFDH